MVRGAGESQLIELMRRCLTRFPGIKVFSLPHMSETDRYVELGVRGEADRIAAAMAELNPTFSTGGIERPGRRIDWTLRSKGLHYKSA